MLATHMSQQHGCCVELHLEITGAYREIAPSILGLINRHIRNEAFNMVVGARE